MAVVLTISSHVARGHVGNAAAAFALARLGHEAWPLATVLMPHHPGHDRGAPRLVTPAAAIAGFVASLDRKGWLGAVDAVLVGYLACADQAGAVAEAVRRVRKRRPDALVGLDPVIGDEGGLYVAEEIAREVHDILLPVAGLATPNSFELGWLTGRKIASTDDAIEAARELGPAEVVVTSAPGAPQGQLRNLAVTREEAFAADGPAVATSVHGAGDLVTALYLGRRLLKEPADAALARATGAVAAVLKETARLGRDELALAAAQDRLADPDAKTRATRIA